MTFFDRYDTETWVDTDGLTFAIHPADDHRPIYEKAGPARQTIVSAVFAVGMAITSLPFSTNAFAVGGQIQLESTSEHAGFHEHDEVAPGHWANLLTLVRNSPQLPADDMTNDPAPLV